jgi:LacI family transcriptional regulator
MMAAINVLQYQPNITIAQQAAGLLFRHAIANVSKTPSDIQAVFIPPWLVRQSTAVSE